MKPPRKISAYATGWQTCWCWCWTEPQSELIDYDLQRRLITVQRNCMTPIRWQTHNRMKQIQGTWREKRGKHAHQ